MSCGKSGYSGGLESSSASVALPSVRSLDTFDAKELSAHLKEVQTLAEKAGDIGWYINHKRVLIRQQYHAQATARREGFLADESVENGNASIAPTTPSTSPNRSIFSGVVCWVNGLTNPPADVLKALLYEHGGTMENILVPGTTHWIAEALPHTKVKEILAHPKHKPVVHPRWITDSIRSGKRLPEKDYFIVQRGTTRTLHFGASQASQTATTGQLVDSPSQDIASPSSSIPLPRPSPAAAFAVSPSAAPSPFAVPRTPSTENRHDAKPVSSVEMLNSNRAQQSSQLSAHAPIKITAPLHTAPVVTPSRPSDLRSPSPSATMAMETDELSATADGSDPWRLDQPDDADAEEDASFIDALDATEEQVNMAQTVPNAQPSSSSKTPTAGSSSAAASLQSAAAAAGFHLGARSTLNDPNFVERYFQQSRLHFLGSWKKHFETLLPSLLLIKPKYEMRSNASAGASFFNSSSSASGSSQRVVMHIDMDCFFVSASIRDEPHLVGKPVVVCHSQAPAGGGSGGGRGTMGSSSISSASYTARTFGIKAETTLGKAVQLCPDLIVKPYEFEKYISVSEEAYRVFFSYTHLVESVSCDEAYLEFPAGVDGLALADEIRADVLRRTRCPCSAGVGHNMLLARLATKKAKPAKSFKIDPKDAMEVLKDEPLASLQGVGYVLVRKLTEQGLKNCSDLHNHTMTKSWLQTTFGQRTGEMLWQYSHGIDPRQLQVERTQRSIGADINYGVRLLEPEQVNAFIGKVAAEVVKRMRVYKLKGYCCSIKAKKRSAGQPVEPTWKFLGHGICDNYSTSLRVKTAITGAPSCVPILARYAIDMYSTFKIPPCDLRGFSISISALESMPQSVTADDSNVPTSNLHAVSVAAASAATANANGAAPTDTSPAAKEVSADDRLHHQQSSSIIVASRTPLNSSGEKPVSPSKYTKYAQNALSAASFGATNEIVPSGSSLAKSSDPNVIIAHREVQDTPFLDVPIPPLAPPPTNQTPDPFVFDPVVKPAFNRDDLRWFPPFAHLDKSVIAELPMEVRKELAAIYKTKRTAEGTAGPTDQANSNIGIPTAMTNPTQPTLQHSHTASPPAHMSTVMPKQLPVQKRSLDPAPLQAPMRAPAPTRPVVPLIAPAGPAAAPSVSTSHSAEIEWSQLDRSVLAELPDSIQAELKAEARRKKRAEVVTLTGGLAGKKRKDAPPVQVINIAAHFKQIEKRQLKRQKQESDAKFRDATCLIVEDSKPDTDVPKPALAAAAASSRMHLAPAVISSPSSAVNPPSVPEVVDISTNVVVSTLPKGFARLDPQAHRTRYATAATALPTHASTSEHARSDSLVVEVTRPASTGSNFPDSDDGGVRAMEIDTGSIAVNHESVYDMSMDDQVIQEIDQSDVNQIDRMDDCTDAPQSELQHVHDPPTSDDSNDAACEVPDPAGDGIPEFELFSSIQSGFHEWLVNVATPPTPEHIDLLRTFCDQQLTIHRNLEVVHSLLTHVRYFASGTWKILSPDASRIAPLWREPFNQLFSEVQRSVDGMMGGRLALHPFITSI